MIILIVIATAILAFRLGWIFGNEHAHKYYTKKIFDEILWDHNHPGMKR